MRYKYCDRCPHHVVDYVYDKAGGLKNIVRSCRAEDSTRSDEQMSCTFNGGMITISRSRCEGGDTFVGCHFVHLDEVWEG